MANAATWKPGQSGNPNGRQPGPRSLAEALRSVGSEKVKVGNKFYTKADWLSRMVWDAVTTTEAKTVDGRVIKLNATAWVDFVKWLHTHVDGPARAEVDVTSGGQPLKAFIGFTPDEWDEPLTVDEPQHKALNNGR